MIIGSFLATTKKTTKKNLFELISSVQSMVAANVSEWCSGSKVISSVLPDFKIPPKLGRRENTT